MTVLNYPGPYQLRLYYTTAPTGLTPMTHVAKYNCDFSPAPNPGDTFASMTVKRRGLGVYNFATYMTDWANLLKPMLSSNANNTIDYAELWKYDVGTFNASFISALGLAVAGTTALAALPAVQNMITFRTLEGGIMKLNILESWSGGSDIDTPPFTQAGLEAIANFVTGTGNAWLGADTSYPFATKALYPGQNEALWRKRYRI
jgi:hypothetical protein